MQSMIYIVITTLLAVLFVGCGDPRATPTTKVINDTPVNQDIDAEPLQSRVENHTVDPPATKVADAGPQKSEVQNHTLEHIRSLKLSERPGWGGFVVVESNSSALGGRNTYKLSAYIEVHPRDTDVDALLSRLNTSYDRACPSGDTCPAWGPTLVEGTTFKAIQRTASILGDSCTTYAIGADATQTYVYDVRLLELDCVQPMSHSSLTSVLKELGLVAPYSVTIPARMNVSDSRRVGATTTTMPETSNPQIEEDWLATRPMDYLPGGTNHMNESVTESGMVRTFAIRSTTTGEYELHVESVDCTRVIDFSIPLSFSPDEGWLMYSFAPPGFVDGLSALHIPTCKEKHLTNHGIAQTDDISQMTPFPENDPGRWVSTSTYSYTLNNGSIISVHTISGRVPLE